MARRSESEIVADLKKRIREKQERAARKSNGTIVSFDTLIDDLKDCAQTFGFHEDEREHMDMAREAITRRRDQLVDDWIQKNG